MHYEEVKINMENIKFTGNSQEYKLVSFNN